MRYLKILAILFVLMGLSACSAKLHYGNHNQEYIRQSHMVHPLVIPPGAKAPKQQSYYKVPNIPASYNAKPVTSLVPPDSNFVKHQKQAAVNTKNTKNTKLANNAPVLVLKKTKATQVWARVGRVLKASNYQILDRDNAMGSYYVLDTQQTNNQITKQTPIYRLYVKQVGTNTQIKVLNQKDRPANAKVASRILATIQTNLKM